MNNKHHAPHTTSNRIVRLALAAAALAVVCAASAASSIIVDSDFRTGDNGWTALFADYLPEQEDSMNLMAGIQPLPAELTRDGTGFFISGQNLSDSLQMVLVRRLGSEDGVVAGQSYAVTFDIAFASAAQSNCVGIGGAPGESVYLRAGAVGTEPMVVPGEDGSGYLRLNVAAGAQSIGGPAASPMGNIANGIPCEEPSPGFVALERHHVHPFVATANDEGELWLLVLIDSGFEGTTALHYLEIEALVEPVPVAGVLANSSARVRVDENEPAIAGWAITGTAPRPVLVRAIGPSLAQFGVEDPLPTPRVQVFDGAGNLIVATSDWSNTDDATALVDAADESGAFALSDGSGDAAVLLLLPAGQVYTAVVRGEGSDAGIALLEIYDLGDPALAGGIVNFSARAVAGNGESTVLGGLVIPGPFPQRVLLRAVGPSLGQFGVGNPLADPALRLRLNGQVIGFNDDLSASMQAEEVQTAAEATGAFPLGDDATSGAMVVTLLPGIYHLEASHGSDDAGTVLLETYRVPAVDD